MQAQPAESTTRIVQQLKQRSAVRILGILRQNCRDAWCRRMLVRLRLPATVHDELVFETPEPELEMARKIVKAEMEGARRLKVPLRVDIGVGKNWKEAK